MKQAVAVSVLLVAALTGLTACRAPAKDPSAGKVSLLPPVPSAVSVPGTVVFMGDGFSGSSSSSSADAGKQWPGLIASAGKVRAVVVARPAVGYLATDSAGTTVAGQITDAVAASPSVVVVAAGSADLSKVADVKSGDSRTGVTNTADPSAVVAGAQAFFTQLRAALPSVPVLVVSPFCTAPADADCKALTSALQPVAAQFNATYVDVSGALPAADVDGNQPTDAGDQAIAAAVQPAFNTIVAPVAVVQSTPADPFSAYRTASSSPSGSASPSGSSGTSSGSASPSS